MSRFHGESIQDFIVIPSVPGYSFKNLKIPPCLISFPGGSVVKNPSEMQESWVRAVGWEDPLEKGLATHSSMLTWRIPMDGGAWRATVHGVAELDTTEGLSTQ